MMSNYEQRKQHQLATWLAGNPWHNPVEDECCPDFSCCSPGLLQPLAIRQTFVAAHEAGSRATDAMLMTFLGAKLSNCGHSVETRPILN